MMKEIKLGSTKEEVKQFLCQFPEIYKEELFTITTSHTIYHFDYADMLERMESVK